MPPGDKPPGALARSSPTHTVLHLRHDIAMRPLVAKNHDPNQRGTDEPGVTRWLGNLGRKVHTRGVDALREQWNRFLLTLMR